MKRMLLVGMLLIGSIISSFSQGLGFNYQAMIRNAQGEAILNQEVVMRIGIVQGSVDGTVLYTETHSTTSNAYGLVNLVVGTGDVVSGVFADIDWATGPFFLKVELDAESNNNFVTLGTTQLLSVPFANYAFSGGSGSKAWVDAEESVSTTKKVGIGTSTPTSYLQIEAQQPTKANEPIFEIKNAYGKTVFAVYENEVKVFVDDTVTRSGGFTVNSRNALDVTEELMAVGPKETTIYINESTAKESRGGFAISGRNSTKGDTIDLFRVSTDLTEIIVQEPVVKESRGGFAISGRNSTKGTVEDLLLMTPSFTEFIVTEPLLKESRGGFAISGRNSTKAITEDLLLIKPSITEFFVEEPVAKESRGGFAISGRNSTKATGAEIFTVTPNLTEIFIPETAAKESRGGFAISGRNSTKEKGMYDIFTVQPERTEIYVKNDPVKAGIPGFSIFGLDDQFGAGELFSVSEAGTFVNTALAVAPKVTTAAIEGITQSEAYGGGAVTDSSGSTIVEVGIIYSTTGLPSLDMTFGDPSVSGIIYGDAAFADGFSGLYMNGLGAGVTYQVRAYAVNADGGTGYGSIVTFTTLPPYTVTFEVQESFLETPINNATITVEQYFYPFSTITNAPGDYTFELVGGQYNVITTADGFYDGSNMIFVDSTQTAKIFLDDAPAQLTMNVIDDLGNPVQYAYIDLYDGVEGFEYAETDTLGVAKAYLNAGTWTYTIYETDFSQQATGQVVMETDVDQAVDIVVQSKPMYSVTVKVLMPDGITTVEGASVNLYLAYKGDEKQKGSQMVDFNGFTGADGTITFDNVPENPYYEVYAQWDMYYRYESVPVTSDTSVDVILQMMAKKDKK